MKNHEIVSHKYKNSKISFVQGFSSAYYINATEMAKPFGPQKSPGQWKRLKEADTIIQTVMQNLHIPEDQLVIKKIGFDQKQGIWMHEIIAMEFA